MPLRFILTCLAFLPFAAAAEPVIDIYVSTGDNHFLGSSLPIDSPASIESTFDLFQKVHHARRIYWRGLEASSWLATMEARPENPRYHSFWEWLTSLYAEVEPDKLAVKAAHARGMEIWGMGSLWDWGAQPDTPGFGDYPFTFESRLRLEHPEWAPVDKQGVRRQGGPIELAYPEARKALIDLTVREALEAGYDGITFLTYVENYSIRFEDEFGYSDPIVEDFKHQYKLDLRTEPFRRGASREDWLRLRGSYVTAFLRELKAELDKQQIKLGIVVNSNDPHRPQSWNVPELMITAGSHHMDVETWVREGLVDALLIYGNNSSQSQMKTLDDLRFLARGTKTEVSVITSGPFRETWKQYQDQGMPTILAVSDDVQHLERGFIPEQTADSLASPDLPVRWRSLAQCIAGKLKLDDATIATRTTSLDLIERRLAIQALGKSPTAELAPLLAALNDTENGVRCVAALALGERKDPGSCTALLDAAAKHGNHMLRECIVIALRRLAPLPTAVLCQAAVNSESPATREVAMRALIPFATAAMLPTFTAGIQDTARFPRYAAAEALGNLSRSPEAIALLSQTLQHHDIAVANRAAASLGKLAQQAPAGTLEKLIARFQTAPDDGWSFRVIGNAITDFGDPGRTALEAIRNGADPRLAELAWRVVDLPQRPNTFSAVTPEQNDAAMHRRPGRASISVDPAAGDDANDGRTQPVKTIARAIRLAQPGDTIHLTPGTYFQSADFINKHGLPGQPITLDGHEALLDGSEPVTSRDWEQVEPGLYRRAKLYSRPDDHLVGRWYLLWNGQMNRMNRCSKGPSAPLKEVANLLPGEWTYVKVEDAFYLRISPEQTLEQANIRYPARANAVSYSSSGSWITVKNVTGTHFYNDGFNVHGAQRHLVFENITAIECGDDGFSAHEDADCHVDGFTSIGNATGLCDTVTSQTHYRNVTIKDCLGYDLYFIGLRHSLENATIQSRAVRAFHLSGDHLLDGQVCELRMKNVRLERVGGGPQELRIGKAGRMFAEGCTFLGLNLTMTPGASVQLRGCQLGGDPKPEVLLFANTIWQGEHNRYNLKSLRIGQTSFTPATFSEFQKITGDKSSLWITGETTPAPR